MEHVHRWINSLMIIALILLCLVACQSSSTLMPATTIAPTSTLTPYATTPQPTTSTAVTPTPYLPNLNNATRIQFAPGSTSAELTGELAAGAIDHYVLGAMAEQTLYLNLVSGIAKPEELHLTIRGAEGNVLSKGDLSAPYEVRLPHSQDYFLTLQSASQVATAYHLNVAIPPLTSTTYPSTVAPEACEFWQELAQNLTYVKYVLDERAQITGLRVILREAVDMPAGWIVEWRENEGPIQAKYGPLHVEPSAQEYTFHAPPQCFTSHIPGLP